MCGEGSNFSIDVSSITICLSPLTEKAAEQAGGFFGSGSLLYPHAVVQPGMVDDGKHGAAGAGFGIERGEDEAVKAGMDHRAGAHGAWLKSNVERAAGEAVVAERHRGGAHGSNFGVGGGVVVAKDSILPAGDDGVLVHDDCADRDLAGFRGEAGFG